MRHLGLVGLLALACTHAVHAPSEGRDAAPEVQPEAAEDASKATHPWTYSPLLEAWLPVSEQELSELRAESPGVVSVNGRAVWIALGGAGARERLRAANGPLALHARLWELQRDELSVINQLAARFPVAIQVVVTTRNLSRLASLTNIEGLELSLVAGTGSSLDWTRLRRLKRLKVSVDSWQPLAGALPPNLEDLEVQSGAVNSADLERISSLPKLRRLRFKTPGAGLELRKLVAPELEELTLWDGVRSQDVATLSRFPKLRKLDAQGAQLSNAAVQHLVKLHALRDLDISRSSIDATGVAKLSILELRRLVPPRFTGPDYSSLVGFRHLRELDLSGAHIHDSQLRVLRGLPELRSLNLAGTRISDAAAATLLEFPLLQRLNLAYTSITGVTVRQLTALSELQELNLQNISVGEGDLDAFAQLQKLRVFTGTGISDRGLRALAALPNLQGLVLDFGPEELDAPALIADMHRLLTLRIESQTYSCRDFQALPVCWENLGEFQYYAGSRVDE